MLQLSTLRWELGLIQWCLNAWWVLAEEGKDRRKKDGGKREWEREIRGERESGGSRDGERSTREQKGGRRVNGGDRRTGIQRNRSIHSPHFSLLQQWGHGLTGPQCICGQDQLPSTALPPHPPTHSLWWHPAPCRLGASHGFPLNPRGAISCPRPTPQ